MEARNKKIGELKYAINFDFTKLKKFELYRRKDNRYFRFIVYDGKNYDELYSYLQNGDDEIKIPQENKLKVGFVYNINGKGCFTKIDMHSIDTIISGNPYVVVNGEKLFQAFNFEVAKWLISNYPGIWVKSLPEMNNNKVNAQNYDTVEMLEELPADSCYRTHNIWVLPNRFRNSEIRIDKIPDEVIESCITAEDCYQEFEIFTENGLKGVRIYGFKEEPIVEAIYKDIIIENYRAYLKNEDGLWAEYSLSNNKFYTDFIYTNIKAFPSEGKTVAYLNDKKIVLHNKREIKGYTIVLKDDFFGLENGKGELVLENVYEWISASEKGYEVFKDGKYGLLNKEGKFILSCIYDQIIVKNPLSPIYYACKDNLWGIVGDYDFIYFDFTDEFPNDDNFEKAVNLYINQKYKQHRLIDTVVNFIDKEKGIIYMKLKNFDKELKVKRYELPDDVYNDVTSSYVKGALYHLSKSAIKVDDDGRLKFSYSDRVKWMDYQKKLRSINEGDTFNCTVYKLTPKEGLVKLENGLIGSVEINGKLLNINDNVQCKVISNRNKLVLELLNEK